MTEKLKNFIILLEKFSESSSSEKIKYFSYYINEILGKEFVNSVDVKDCFLKLDIQPYSNISAYLSKNSKRNGSFIKISKKGYRLNSNEKARIEIEIGKIKKPIPTNALLPLESFIDTKSYIEKLAKEINSCYDLGLYTGAIVLLRRLFETLVIEAYEKHKIENKIKGSDGYYVMFSKLLNSYISEPIFKASRNLTESIKKIKKIGDACAHNRKFIGKESHIKPLREDFILALEEMIETIDF